MKLIKKSDVGKKYYAPFEAFAELFPATVTCGLCSSEHVIDGSEDLQWMRVWTSYDSKGNALGWKCKACTHVTEFTNDTIYLKVFDHLFPHKQSKRRRFWFGP